MRRFLIKLWMNEKVLDLGVFIRVFEVCCGSWFWLRLNLRGTGGVRELDGFH